MHVSVCDYLMCMCVCLSVHILVVSWIGLVLCLWSDGVGMAIQPMNLITRHDHPCQHCDQLRPQEAGGVGQEDIQLVETAPQEPPLLSMQSRPARVQHKRDRLGGAALAVGIVSATLSQHTQCQGTGYYTSYQGDDPTQWCRAPPTQYTELAGPGHSRMLDGLSCHLLHFSDLLALSFVSCG